MTKLKGLMLLVLVLTTINGCTSYDPALNDLPAPEVISNPEQSLERTAAPADPDPASDVINLHGHVTNLYKLDEFIQEENSVQRIASYTIEGDPIFYTLEYTKEGTIHVQHDTRMDHFGSREVLAYTCSSLERTEVDNSLIYELIGCDDAYADSILLLQLDYRPLNKENHFNFRLEYGVNGSTLVDTKKQELNVKVSSDVNATVSDYRLSEEDMILIYKEATNQGLLWDQNKNEGSITCNKKPYENYKLSLYDDDNTYHYEWNECDNNRHNLTILKNVIVSVIQKDEVYGKLTEDMHYAE